MEQILIEENGKNYLLKFEIKDENLSLVVNIVEKNCGAYEIRKNLDDWKKIHIIFGCFQNLEKIKDFFINAINKKDLKIKLSQNKLLLEINIEILYETQIISIELTQKEINKDDLIMQLCDIINKMRKEKSVSNLNIINELESHKKDIDALKSEIKKLNQIIKDLKDSYNNIEHNYFYGSSILRNREEVNLLKSSIKEKLGKDVKYFKRLYKASSDGEEASTFHQLCDNIENTISLVETGGHRRFGGFTTQTWNQVSSYTKTDQHAFVFSLDKLKIYPYTNNGRAIRCDNNYHPTFGVGYCDFRLCGQPLTNKTLYTNQTSGDRSYNYNGDKNALSEDGSGNTIATLEIEVYQVMF
jgi:hypothetical protein